MVTFCLWTLLHICVNGLKKPLVKLSKYKKKTQVMFLFDAVFVDGAIWVANGKRGQSTRLHSGKMYSFSPFSALGRACHITLQFSCVNIAAKAEKPAEVTLLSSKALAAAKY